MIFNKLLYRISLNKARSLIMVFNCNINAFIRLNSIIHLYNENMDLSMTIKKFGSVYKSRVGRANGNEHIFYFGLNLIENNFIPVSVDTTQSNVDEGVDVSDEWIDEDDYDEDEDDYDVYDWHRQTGDFTKKLNAVTSHAPQVC